MSNYTSYNHAEAIARIIAGDKHNEVLRSKMAGKRRWELFIPKALKVISYVEDEMISQGSLLDK